MQVYNKARQSVYDKVQEMGDDFMNATDNVTLEGKIAKQMMDDSVHLNEMTMNDPLYESKDILNNKNTKEVVKIAVKKLKLNK